MPLVRSVPKIVSQKKRHTEGANPTASKKRPAEMSNTGYVDAPTPDRQAGPQENPKRPRHSTSMGVPLVTVGEATRVSEHELATVTVQPVPPRTPIQAAQQGPMAAYPCSPWYTAAPVVHANLYPTAGTMYGPGYSTSATPSPASRSMQPSSLTTHSYALPQWPPAPLPSPFPQWPSAPQPGPFPQWPPVTPPSPFPQWPPPPPSSFPQWPPPPPSSTYQWPTPHAESSHQPLPSGSQTGPLTGMFDNLTAADYLQNNLPTSPTDIEDTAGIARGAGVDADARDGAGAQRLR
ncbi:hypothetical protein C8Q72DRAFT_890351 [Fomitopsis betulina]|nr:hypothetical protein C8Q72DRAFT_890351 [Fomitopsis betulina]